MNYPVPIQAATVLQSWAFLLARRAGITVEEFRAEPERHMSFPLSAVRVDLMDGSYIQLKYAFALVNEELKSIAVFSEHCGHFVLPFHEAKVYQGGELQYAQSAA
jgi:hypothetical protein